MSHPPPRALHSPLSLGGASHAAAVHLSEGREPGNNAGKSGDNSVDERRGDGLDKAANDSRQAVAGTMVVVLTDLARQHQAWGWLRLAQGAGALKDTPGLRFAKVMGSGHGGGFSLRPSASHQGLITVFEHARQAHDFLNGPFVAACHERARESWSAMLSVDSARGEWDGQAWARTPVPAMDVEPAKASPALSRHHAGQHPPCQNDGLLAICASCAGRP